MNLEELLNSIDERIKRIEENLNNSTIEDMETSLGSLEVLSKAISVRSDYGRISDFIHARSIIKYISDNQIRGIQSLSLGAITSEDSRYDMITSNGLYEFKMSQWNGRDSARKKSAFKDFCDLVLAQYHKEYSKKSDKFLILFDSLSMHEFKKLYSSKGKVKNLITASQFETMGNYIDELNANPEIEVGYFMKTYGSNISIKYIYE